MLQQDRVITGVGVGAWRGGVRQPLVTCGATSRTEESFIGGSLPKDLGLPWYLSHRLREVLYRWWQRGNVYIVTSWSVMMTLSNGNISTLWALCAGNSPVTGEFPPQRPVMRSFDVFVDLRLNKRLSKQSAGDLRRRCAHYNVTILYFWAFACSLLVAWTTCWANTHVTLMQYNFHTVLLCFLNL